MRICMLLHKSVEHDSRVRREARALAGAGHEVTVVHLPPERHMGASRLDGFRAVSATPPAWVRRAFPFHAYRLVFLGALVRRAVGARPDVVHAHDAPMLVPGLAAARIARAKLVYDSHELASGVPYRDRAWRALVNSVERVLIRRCSAVITVSDGIADRLRELYRLGERPAVVRNLPDVEVARNGGGLRERLGIGDAPLVLHQGAAAPGRGCETLIRAIGSVPEAHLVFLGDPWPGYGDALDDLTKRFGVADRVHFAPSVSVGELLGNTREADVGVSLLEDGAENHRLALPNKVFEYVAAGVPVVVSELPELSRLVHEHGIGWTADPADPSSVAGAIKEALLEGSQRTVRLELAAATLTWEREKERLLDAYRGLAAAPAPRRGA